MATSGVLNVIGLGLGDEKDITVKGLEAVKRSGAVFLEAYTSVLGVDPSALEAFYGKSLIIADRDMVESRADEILGAAKKGEASLLVAGDPLCATTHTDLVIRAKEEGIQVNVINNASVLTAIAICGLQLYSFGQTVSIPFFNDEWRPDSFYKKVAENLQIGLHSLCLLDIKVKEPDFEAMVRGQTKFLPPRYMTVQQALRQMLEIEEKLALGVMTEERLCVGLSRLGQPDQFVCVGTAKELLEVDCGPPLHSLIIVGQTHVLEQELMSHFRVESRPAVTGQVGVDGEFASRVFEDLARAKASQQSEVQKQALLREEFGKEDFEKALKEHQDEVFGGIIE